MSISIDDTFGTIVVTEANPTRFESYYSVLAALRPLLADPEWKSVTNGYYLNVGGRGFDAVRISYFSPAGTDPRELVRAFLPGPSLQLADEPQTPRHVEIARNYGGEEIRFRRYLIAYCPIGLEIMQANLHHAQCLFATFRWQIFMAGGDFTEHFRKTFESLSPSYRSMSDAARHQFWSDLKHWPNPPQVDWAHMFVNMVLACDWNGVFAEGYSREPLSIPQINRALARTGHVFQIPADWRPEQARGKPVVPGS